MQIVDVTSVTKGDYRGGGIRGGLASNVVKGRTEIHARLLSSKLGLLTLHLSPPSGRSFPRDLTALFSGQLAFPGFTSQLAQMNRVRILFLFLFHRITVNLSPAVVVKARIS